MAINCCYGCVPPKRTPTCKFDGTCDRYENAKKEHDAEQAATRESRRVNNGILQQKQDGIRRALRAKGRR